MASRCAAIEGKSSILSFRKDNREDNMENIVMYVGKGDKALVYAVSSVLMHSGGTLISSGGRFICRGGIPERTLHIIREGEQLPRCGGILVLGDTLSEFSCGGFTDGYLSVVNSRNLRALSCISGTRAVAVGCSPGNLDTVSISGSSGDSIAVCLNRSLVFDGRLIPPQEIIIRTPYFFPPYAILAAGAVALLTGTAVNGRIELMPSSRAGLSGGICV